MKILTLAALSGFFGLTLARIEAFAVPATVKPGEEFNVILMNFNYIQSVDEVAAAFGVAPGNGFPGVLGQAIHSAYLGPTKSHPPANYSIPVTVPTWMTAGPATFTTALFRLYGASDMPASELYSAPITLGSETSEALVVSSPVVIP